MTVQWKEDFVLILLVSQTQSLRFISPPAKELQILETNTRRKVWLGKLFGRYEYSIIAYSRALRPPDWPLQIFRLCHAVQLKRRAGKVSTVVVADRNITQGHGHDARITAIDVEKVNG
jgi:hypothetical protein